MTRPTRDAAWLEAEREHCKQVATAMARSRMMRVGNDVDAIMEQRDHARDEALASVEAEVKRVFASEFQAELRERTLECDQLAAAKLALQGEVERLKAELADSANLQKWRALKNECAKQEGLARFQTAEVERAENEVRVLREELKQAYDLANYPDAASFRPDVVFARGYRQGRKEALAEFHGTSVCPGCEHYKKLADMNVYAAEYVDAQEDVDRLEATIARVEALPAEWREKARQLRGYDVGMHEVEKCADELDAALRGPA